MKKLFVPIAVLLLAAGCASKETQTEAGVTDRTAGGQTPSASGTQGSTTRSTTTSTITGDPLRDPNSPLAKRSVYFDFDSNSVKDEYRPLIQAHSGYLSRDKRDARIRIEGNCDERGSREYNLALGQRRAESVKKMMTVLGVGDSRIETVSYGEEKPVAQGHDESAWAQNRRADIKYSGE